MIRPETSLPIPHQTIEKMCGEFKRVEKMIDQLQALYTEGGEIMASQFDEKYMYECGRYSFPSGEAMKKHVLRSAWKYIYAQTEILELCTESKAAEFEKFLDGKNLPELEPETIKATVLGLIRQAPDLLLENIRDVFHQPITSITESDMMFTYMMHDLLYIR